jgi:hypothetical protein
VPLLFWDASALGKRYVDEPGSDTVDALLDHPLAPDQATTPLGYLETYSVLLRRHNDGRFDLPSFMAAITALQAEVLDSGDFGLLSIADTTIFASPLMLRRHNLNATDAAILTMLLQALPNLPPGETLVLVASDARLLRVGASEKLVTFNPETVVAADVPAFLTAL